MRRMASWIRKKDEKWFQPFFDRHPEIEIHNALTREVNLDQADALLLTGGSDIAPEFLRQEVPDPSVLEKDVDPALDRWEFEAVKKAIARGLPIFAICKGMQVL